MIKIVLKDSGVNSGNVPVNLTYANVMRIVGRALAVQVGFVSAMNVLIIVNVLAVIFASRDFVYLHQNVWKIAIADLVKFVAVVHVCLLENAEII